MKVRFDENISPRVAASVSAFVANRAGYEVSHVRQAHGPGTSDPDWLTAFAAEGGTAIISGDYNIVNHWPNLVAYMSTGLISFFPPHNFERLAGFGKGAYLLRWWPAIIEKIKISERGDRWRLPNKWVDVRHVDMELLRDPRVDGDKTKPVAENVVELHRKAGQDD